MERVPLTQWVAWIMAAATGTFSIMAFSYSEFQTKEAAHKQENVQLEKDSALDRRLERIEEKLDRLIESRRR